MGGRLCLGIFINVRFNYNAMGEQPNTRYDFWETVGKVLMAAGYITLGVIAKLAIDSRQVKLTRWQIIFKIAIMLPIGFCSFMACYATNRVLWAGVVTPISTMLGEPVALWILNNVNGWLDWFSAKIKKNGNGNNNK